MEGIRLWSIFISAITASSLLTADFPAFGQKQESWQIVVSKSLMEDEAIKVVLEDLKKTGKELGIVLKVVGDDAESLNNAVVVGDSIRNKVTAALVKQGKIKLKGVSNEQGYQIRTVTTDGGRAIIVAGGSVIGDVYGLYWIWDRMRVLKKIPQINVKREPVLKIRCTLANSEDAIRNALRSGVNWVIGENPLNLVPWQAEPQQTENEKNREKTRELIEYAHSLHLRYCTYGDEFTYHPSLLEEFGATLSPSDPALWDTVQAKYRRLLHALPEVDGVMIRTGELTQIWGNYEAFDVMHNGQGCDWPLEKRYRTFIKKIYDVVVGEFDRIYIHRTWGTSSYQQHSQPDVFRKIFTEDVPAKNLVVSIKLTQTDCWYHQSYNPTFGVTAHDTLVELQNFQEYHSNYGTFPDFPGQYYQAGIQTILESGQKNLKAARFGSPSGWRTIAGYAAYRLAWNPYEDIREISKEFSSVHFGKAAADKMAEIYLLASTAYKYGLYIEPVAYGVSNPLAQLRHSIFPAQGYSDIDKGKEHVAFLHKIYLRCKPWIAETLDYLDHGFKTSNEMCRIFQQVEPLIKDSKLAQEVENSLELTRLLIKTNNLYAKTCFAYFEYRENPTAENKSKLKNFFSQLKNTRKRFIETPGCGYKLFGVDHLLINVERALVDLTEAEQILAEALTPVEIERTIAGQQEKYVKVLEEHSQDAVKFLLWQGKVDGRDILKIKGKNLEVEHIRHNLIVGMTYSFLKSLPDKPVTVILRDIESRSVRPFILEQPTRENNYTVKVYLYDVPGGLGWWRFDLYYIPKTPEQLGLEIPWEK